MKIPLNVSRVTLNTDIDIQYQISHGFIDFEEGSDGAGNYYGLYWQFGREQDYPIVCFYDHEEAVLLPQFKSLDDFLGSMDEWGNVKPYTIDLKDELFFLNPYYKAKVLTKHKKHLEAIEKLKKSVSCFHEYSDTWTLLAINYYAAGNNFKGDLAICNAFLSNYAFGFPSTEALEILNRIDVENLNVKSILVGMKGCLKFADKTDYASEIIIDSTSFNNLVQQLETSSVDARTSFIMKQNYRLLMQTESDFNLKEYTETLHNRALTLFPNRKIQ